MTEHEKLKAICDVIGYKLSYIFNNGYVMQMGGNGLGVIRFDVREIIFTPEFIQKFNEYRYKHDIYPKDGFNLMEHLDDPVSYIFNLLDLGQNN